MVIAARAGIVWLGVASLALATPPLNAFAKEHTAMTGHGSVAHVAGTPVLGLGDYDLGQLGYTVEEYFISGTAQSYQFAATPGADGKWSVAPDVIAPYVTRIVVVRPIDPAKFSGTVIAEWVNVSGGGDLASAWTFAHREMVRNGDVFVGVSAQRVGVEGGGGVMGSSFPSLKQADPERYGRLKHPGDAFSFDIFSQVGRMLKDPKAGLLGPLRAERVLGTGESQSAVFLVTYVNAIDPIAHAYDGFLIHSRFGSAAPISGDRISDKSMPPDVRYRTDMRVPVLTLISETDLSDATIRGYYGARQPDAKHLRTWEMAGTAHADRYVVSVGASDSGLLSIEQLAAAYAETGIPNLDISVKMNDGPQQHYIIQSAFRKLDQWVATGKAPPTAAPIEYRDGAYQRDAHGIVKGGVRSPWVDVPAGRLSGVVDDQTSFLALMGSTEHYDRKKLDQLYPGGKAEYLAKFEKSLDSAIAKGFILPSDRQEILSLTAARYPK